jgi:uncharacterized protein (TIGR03083 family)
MDLTRTETIEGMLNEYAAFADLIAPLTDGEWDADSRCASWQVRDVAGHVTGLCEDVVAGVPGSRNGDEEAASLRGESPAVVAARLRAAVEQLRPLGAALDDDEAWAGPSGVPDLSMGEGVLTLWYDTFVHADDVHAALGRPALDGPGLRASVVYLEGELTRRKWGPASIALTDQPAGDRTVVVGEVGPGSPSARATTRDFVLAATGRIDPATIGLDADLNIYAD